MRICFESLDRVKFGRSIVHCFDLKVVNSKWLERMNIVSIVRLNIEVVYTDMYQYFEYRYNTSTANNIYYMLKQKISSLPGPRYPIVHVLC